MKKALFFLLSVIFSVSLYCNSVYNVENKKALAGRGLKIHTDWDFFWGKFLPPDDLSQPDLVVSVPSIWNKYDLPPEAMEAARKGKGSGTFRLKITGLESGKKYSFPVFELCYTAFSVLADDAVIYRSGTPSEKWENTIARQYCDKATFTAGQDGSVLITFYVSNSFYRKGGFRGDFVLYEESAYMNRYKKRLCYYTIFSGILLAIVAYCMLIAILKKDRTNFFLSLFVLSIYSRIIASVFPLLKILFPQMSFSLIIRIEYISLFMAPALYALYIDSMNKKIFHHIPAKYVCFPALIFLILDFILPPALVNRLVPAMEIYMFLMIGLILFLFMVRVVKNRDFTSISAILSLLIIFLGVVNDFFLHIQLLPLHNIEVKLLVPSFVIYAFIQTVLLAYIQNKNQKRIIELNNNLTVTNNAYYRFVPKEFLEFLGKKDITELALGEYKISKMAVLSADIRNFTAASEKMEGLKVFEMLNSYLGRVAPLIRKNGGIIEKYLGDGIIAIFPESALAALNCAVQMQEAMIELRQDFEKRGLPAIKIGVGIHYGNIVIGTGGDSERMTEISLSRDIDRAVKTEAQTKELKRPILATSRAVAVAAEEAKEKGQKFDFCGRRLFDSEGNVLYALYTETTGSVL
ncbi:MAG: adenylate/guanylate cyclase domain-containing protein [Treponema sp.]|nr:adenylate/guanylate cyclase domain-containing protein [Treponema sp.]